LTHAEKVELAESLDSYPQRYFQGMAGFGLFLHRERLKSRLAGCSLHILAQLASLGEKITDSAKNVKVVSG